MYKMKACKNKIKYFKFKSIIPTIYNWEHLLLIMSQSQIKSEVLPKRERKVIENKSIATYH